MCKIILCEEIEKGLKHLKKNKNRYLVSELEHSKGTQKADIFLYSLIYTNPHKKSWKRLELGNSYKSYYRQIFTDINIRIIRLEPIVLTPRDLRPGRTQMVLI